MKVLQVALAPGDSIRDIFRVFEVAGAEKVVFICPRHFSVLSDISFLKKLKGAALQFNKKIAFVVKEAALLDILNSQDIEALPAAPDLAEGEMQVALRDLFPKEKAKKNAPVIASHTRGGAKVEHPKFSTRKIENTHGESSARGKIFFGFLGVVGFLGIIWVWLAPSATITIKSRVSPIPVTQNFLITLPAAEIPEDSQTLPQVDGIYVQTEVRETEVMPSTGRRYDVTDAKGKVTLYNETNQPKFLLPSRLSSAEGVIVRFEEEVIIPPHDGNKPGSIVVEVRADPYDEDQNPIGDKGNLMAGTELIFPALREESQELYYAKANKGPLVGGSTLTHYFVAEEDKELSQASLFEVFKIRGVDRLQEEVKNRSNREGKNYILLDKAGLLKSDLKDFVFPEHLSGEEVQTFEVSGAVFVSGVVFDQTPVVDFLEEKVEQNQDARKKLLRVDPTSVTYQVLAAEELEEKQWVKLSISATGIETLDLNPRYEWAAQWFENLKKQIVDRPVSEVRGLLANDPEIEEVLDIDVSPFWGNRLPRMWERIEFKLQ